MDAHRIVTAALATLLAAPCFAQDKATAKAAFDRATKLLDEGDHKGAEAAATQAVEADPDDLAMHDLLLRTLSPGRSPSPARVEEATKQIEQLYAGWAKRFPRSSGVAYGLGAWFCNREDPRAKPHLERAVELDPKLANVWQMLSIDAERWGNQSGAREYMRKAKEAAPENPDYAFYYASSWHGVDDAKWTEASLDVVKAFPHSNRSAQALYWLGVRTAGDAKKIAFWERSRRQFPPAEFSWSRSSLGMLFEAYLRTDPEKALAFANELAEPERKEAEARESGGAGGQGSRPERRGERWLDRAAVAQAFLETKALLAAGKYAEARSVAEKIKADRSDSNAALFARLKAEVLAGAGQVEVAFEALAKRVAETPDDATKAELLRYGKQIGKSAADVDAAVWKIRDAAAKPAPEFELDTYGAPPKKATLRDFRGKVVLLTFWFPGCGPCRGEFPHFENVFAKFRGQDVVYLGINGLVDQDAYVRPFMEGTKYSFIPLRADDKVCKPEAYGVRGYPANFLIDRDGRIVFQRFRTDSNNEIELQRMIEALLERPAGSAGQAQPAVTATDAAMHKPAAASRPASAR